MDWIDWSFLISAIAIIGGGCVLLWNGLFRREASPWQPVKFWGDTMTLPGGDVQKQINQGVRHTAATIMWQDRDPALIDLNTRIAKAKRQHKKHSHLEAAKTARVHELLRS